MTERFDSISSQLSQEAFLVCFSFCQEWQERMQRRLNLVYWRYPSLLFNECERDLRVFGFLPLSKKYMGSS